MGNFGSDYRTRKGVVSPRFTPGGSRSLLEEVEYKLARNRTNMRNRYDRMKIIARKGVDKT